MTILPLDPVSNATPEALHAFIEQCRSAARRDGRAKLVSISLSVDALEPLAVLESIFEPGEPHFYAERPGIETAIAGAEAAARHTARGPSRFAEVQRWIDDTLAHTIAVGDVNAPFGGPHVFGAFTFGDEVEAGEPFAPATVFIPRWQVARAGAGTTAVANFSVAPEADLAPLVEKVWRAHGKFSSFRFKGSTGEAPSATSGKFHRREVGDYRASVSRALQLIAKGIFRKIVLARIQDVRADQPLHPLEMLNRLRQRFPDCYSFSFTEGKGPSFIGASPERLVQVSKNILETEALAGSMRRGASASEDAALAGALLASEKDRREQQEVLDDIVARLTPLGLKLEFPPKPQLRRLANVQHLHTPVRAVLPEGARLLDVLGALHPTPAVGGSPREAAVAHIRELEAFPRGLYAGALGWLNARGGGEFFVGLRSALVEGSTARLYAGAGLVAGSTPEKEFAETELKFQAMLEALLTP